MLRKAKTLNFRNSAPSVSFKATRISEMTDAAEGNVQLGNDLNREADGFLNDARSAFRRITSDTDDIVVEIAEFENKVNADAEGEFTNNPTEKKFC